MGQELLGVGCCAERLDRAHERGIERGEIEVAEGRRLVEDLMGRDRILSHEITAFMVSALAGSLRSGSAGAFLAVALTLSTPPWLVCVALNYGMFPGQRICAPRSAPRGPANGPAGSCDARASRLRCGFVALDGWRRLALSPMHLPLMNGKIPYPHRHLLGIDGLARPEIESLLDLADDYVALSRQIEKKSSALRGRTQINLFFEPSTRTQSSFELAGKRLGADVMNMSVGSSSVKKGETLIDTAITLNAMRPDVIVVRHHAAGAVNLLARKVDCSVVNAGDGAHEHPTQALLDALTIRRAKGRIEGLVVAICGDILHSRVARSNIICLAALGAVVRIIGPSTLLPAGIERFGVEVHADMREGLAGADIVMMLRLQRERMNGAFLPSVREYFRYFGLDREKLALAKADALVMHPGPMNRGVEISSDVADGAQSLIREQVEMGVAVRMAVLEALARHLPNG